MALASRITLKVESTNTNALDLVTVTAPLVYSLQKDLATGTGANQADLLFSDTRTLGPSATEDLDLAGGSLTSPFGATLTFARVKMLLIKAASTNTNDVVVSRAAAGIPLLGATGDLLPVKPDGGNVWWAPGPGIVVTPTTADTITITNSAGTTSVTYDVVIIGASS